MMRFDRFTEAAQETAQRCAEIIKRYNQNLIDTEHMLLALVEQHDRVVSKIFEMLYINVDDLCARLETTLQADSKTNSIGPGKDQIFITPRVKRIIDLANEEANRMMDEYISTEHILLSILTERNTPAARILISAGLNQARVYAVLKEIRKSKQFEDSVVKKRTTKVQDSEKPKPSTNKRFAKNNNVFIVHGHDEAMKLAVARTVEKLGLNAIVLHEKPNQGKTIIEKFTEYSDVGFSIVLLSPDDVSLSADGTLEKRLFRARQNVIFELGFFIGKLGRDRVISLYRQTDGFELPSDYSGVLFVPFDDYNQWRFDLIRELRASGYKVDANKLLE